MLSPGPCGVDEEDRWADSSPARSCWERVGVGHCMLTHRTQPSLGGASAALTGRPLSRVLGCPSLPQERPHPPGRSLTLDANPEHMLLNSLHGRGLCAAPGPPPPASWLGLFLRG